MKGFYSNMLLKIKEYNEEIDKKE